MNTKQSKIRKRTLQIQIVYYNNDQQKMKYSLISLARAVELARENHTFTDVNVRIGDCGSNPVFDDKTMSQMVKQFEPVMNIEYTFFNRNLGSAAGHNTLAKGCKTDYIMTLNPDVTMAPDLFQELVIPFDSGEKVGAVEAKQIPIEHPKYFNVENGETSWLITACALFSTKIFKKAGGFDQDSFFLYCDDVDISWKIRLLGYKIIYQPSAVIFHDKFVDKNGHYIFSQAEKYYSAESSLFLTYKWSRPDLTKKLLKQFLASDDKDQIKAAEKFLAQKKNNKLPKQLDQKHRIAEFIDGNYTEHRF